MAQQIKFFKQNKVDLVSPNIDITVTDSTALSTGDAIADRVRNRSNRSAWRTTGSTDAGTTTLTVSMGDALFIDRLVLVKHNFKSFTVKYWNGLIYQDFSTPINETTNTLETNYYEFDNVAASKIQIIINGTQTADEDKYLYQLLVTEQEGQLDAWPEIKKPTHVRNVKKTTMLSGKTNLLESVGRFSCQLSVGYWKDEDDLVLVEKLYLGRRPMLVWLCGGDEDQFGSVRAGYRLEDFYLMRPTNDYIPEWVNYVYTTGLKLDIKLDEVVD